MSVFNDFQRLWMQRFPQSSLSDAWEQDVRASLERHKLHIAELSKELEQETLYVEYLERLLCDVEKYRESGGDPTTLFEAATGGNGNGNGNGSSASSLRGVGIDSDNANPELVKSSLNLRESNSGLSSDNKDKTNRLSLNTDNKYTTHTNSNAAAASVGTTVAAAVGAAKRNANAGSSIAADADQSYEKEDKDIGTEKDVRNEKNGALQQCITELAASIDKQQRQKQAAAAASEMTASTSSSTKTTSAATGNSQQQSTVTATSLGSTERQQRKPATPEPYITVIEVTESKEKDNDDNMQATGGGGGMISCVGDATTTTSTFSSFERKSTRIEPTAPPLSPALPSPSMSASSYQAHLDAKKKMPPRPPPKNIRRVEPPTIPGQLSSSPKRDGPFTGSAMPLPSSSGSFSSSESPGNSLERNVKPSERLRQKSNESLDAKTFATNRRTTPESIKFGNSSELMEELGRKVGKSESLEKAKRIEAAGNVAASSNSSGTSSLGRTASTPSRAITPGRSSVGQVGASPTGSLTKATTKFAAADSSSTGSLEKRSRNSLQSTDADNGAQQQHHQQQQQQQQQYQPQHIQRNVGSKESLASQGISEVIKSYESVSSLSSDSAKVAQPADNEPYYDTVPLDNGDGEYVYINPGRTGSSSSRDDLSTPGSTLPMGSAAHLSSQASVTDPESPGRTSNYVNIDYFMNPGNETRSSSLDSEGEYDGPPILRAISQDESSSQTPGALRKNLVSAILVSSNARGARIRSILNGIIQSETIYVECLNKMRQYQRAIHSTLGTSQPVIKEEEEHTIFFKIEELYKVHTAFLADLKTTVSHEGGDVLIGETFKRLAEMFTLYSAFLHNYGQAIETVKKCSASNPQFKKIVSTIILKMKTEQSLTLEDLLHKPVARVQINALVFDDLLHETPPNHPDHQPLRKAQNTIHMFLDQFNVVNQRLPSESNKNLRRMLRNSFIVELVDGHRKLRHLFLFNDVIACAKHKALGRDRIDFDYDLKWFIPLKDVIIIEESETNADLKESSPANISQLKKNLRSVRDQVALEEKDGKANGVRINEKYRRKMSDLESQLVLASPNLVFRLSNKTNNKVITFFLSSEFERSQWIDSIMSLKQNCNLPGANTINTLEVTAFIVAMQKGMKTEMGSYLMRNKNDESLLVGDLHFTVLGLTGLEQPADLYICIEVDSYGHYFCKATTKTICRSVNPVWNEAFVIELEGSQNVRILVYESQERPFLRAKYVLKLSCSWLQETTQSRDIKLGETLELNTKMRFVPGELCRATSKPGPLFGAKMSQVLKREKRDIPFIISACIREVERRGMLEVGVYRVSGSASDLAKLKKAFETDSYEAEQLLKEVDIHSVTGILKSYLRELPEALFSDALYPKFFETYNAFSNNNEAARIIELLKVFEELPTANKSSINHILEHLIRVHEKETDNKMSLHNLAMVFGPTLLRPGQTQVKQKDPLAASTVDVMAQAGILYCFLLGRIKKV